MTFKGSTVLWIIGFLITTFSGAGWFLFTAGAFSPDTQLTKQLAEAEYRNESATKDYELAMAKIDTLERQIEMQNSELASLRSGIESERILSEERLNAKKLELENARLIEIAKMQSETRAAESRARVSISEQELRIVELETEVRKVESENEKKARIIADCVSAIPPNMMVTGSSQLDQCTQIYEDSDKGQR